MRYALLYPVFFLQAGSAFCGDSAAAYNSLYLISEADTPALYPGGNEKFIEYLESAIRPSRFLHGDAEGMVHVTQVTFTVTRDGTVTDALPGRSTYFNLENDILRAIANTSGWVPARKNSKPAACRMGIVLEWVIENGFFRLTGQEGTALVKRTSSSRGLKWILGLGFSAPLVYMLTVRLLKEY